jgi:uncharacterized heparinase superfamily protein
LLGRLHAQLGAAVRPVFGTAMRGVASYHAFRALRFGVPARLRVAPQDLRTGDATVAQEIYSGIFTFHGKTFNAGSRPPFALAAPSADWRRTLCGFAWLRHLRAAGAPWARETAQALVGAFIERPLLQADPALEPAVTARRMLSFLAHSPMLLEGASPEFYENLAAALADDAQRLADALWWGRVISAERLLCALALTELGACADLAVETRAQSAKFFMEELERQILQDGGHVGRNPQTALDLLLDLLPLRSLYAARGAHAPQAVQGAIDRMVQTLRMLRHGDGALALFNGMSVTAPGDLATVFMHQAPSEPPLAAPQSGYLRLVAGEALVLVDAGTPPPREFSRRAHAGTLSFEFSLGRERVVVNCGAPPRQGDGARESARATAAHSTLVVAGESSCEIAPPRKRRHAGLILSGPRVVALRRRRSSGGDVARLAHDGYASRFGLIHQRVLALSQNGALLCGSDRLIGWKADRRGHAPREFSVRFHLHPSVEARRDAESNTIALSLPSGAELVFEAEGFDPLLEDSVFHATPEGARHARQIVLEGRAEAGARVRWAFRRIDCESP